MKLGEMIERLEASDPVYAISYDGDKFIAVANMTVEDVRMSETIQAYDHKGTTVRRIGGQWEAQLT